MIYGAVQLPQGQQEQTNPFESVSQGVKNLLEVRTMQAQADKAEKEKSESSMGNIPLVSSASMFDSHARAWQTAADQLKADKDKYMETPEGIEEYNKALREIEFGIAESEKYYQEIAPKLDRNMKIAHDGVNPTEWEKRGQRDSNTEDHYAEVLQGLDNPERFSVRIEGGSVILNDGTTDIGVQDPSLMNLTIADESFVPTDIKKPEDWWQRSRQDSMYENKAEATKWAKAKIADDPIMRRDAARYFVENSENAPEGMTWEEVMNEPGRIEEAIEEYAIKAAEGFKKKKESKPEKAKTAEEKRVERIDSDLNKIVPRDLDQPDGTTLHSSQFRFTDSYSINTVGFDGDYTDDEGNAVTIKAETITLTEGGKPTLIASNGYEIPLSGANLTQVRNQIDSQAGEGTFDKIIEKLQSETYGSGS